MSTTRALFDQQLRDLQQDMLRMGDFVEEMLTKAMEALVAQNTSLAEDVIRMDDIADNMDLDIENKCMRLLALQQPMSKDLRTIGTVLKIITDLERVGDHAVLISRTVKVLTEEPFFKPLEDIPRLASMAKQLLRESLQAFVDRDLQLVHKICRDDVDVDALFRALVDELIDFMRQDPSLVKQATHLLSVARVLERVADHATNIAERVAYMETGKLEPIAALHKHEP